MISDAMNLCQPLSAEMDSYWVALDVAMSFDTLGRTLNENYRVVES